MVNSKLKDVINSFRADRGQTTEHSKIEKDDKPRGEFYKTFLKKYRDLERCIDHFGTRDLVYFFREIAEESGHKYFISNIKRDMAVMKRLKDSYSTREICAMVEFLFFSEQDYLEKDNIGITLLVSSWVNKIYADTKLWAEDKYCPSGKKQKGVSHEWDKEEHVSSGIGVKL